MEKMFIKGKNKFFSDVHNNFFYFVWRKKQVKKDF